MVLTVIAAGLYPLRTTPGQEAQHVHGSALPDHAAHCLFCLTGAFATEPEPGLNLPRVRRRAAGSPIFVPRPASACLGLPDARAPPPRA